MYKDLQLPSDFLIDNHKSLQRRNDFEDLCESLDELQHEAMNLAFQDGFNQGELNILRQFVEGKLDRDYVLEMFGAKLGLRETVMNDLTVAFEKIGKTTLGLDKTAGGFEIWISNNVERYRTIVKLDLTEQEVFSKYMELRHVLLDT